MQPRRKTTLQTVPWLAATTGGAMAQRETWGRQPVTRQPLAKQRSSPHSNVAVIVHRDSSVRFALAPVLRRDGYRVAALGSSAELLDWLAERAMYPGCEPALIVAELTYLSFGVLQVAASLRHAGWRTPVVLLTEKHSRLSEEACQRLARVAVFATPYDWDDVCTAASRLVATAKMLPGHPLQPSHWAA